MGSIVMYWKYCDVLDVLEVVWSIVRSWEVFWGHGKCCEVMGSVVKYGEVWGSMGSMGKYCDVMDVLEVLEVLEVL
jgi:hypothetical protein